MCLKKCFAEDSSGLRSAWFNIKKSHLHIITRWLWCDNSLQIVRQHQWVWTCVRGSVEHLQCTATRFVEAQRVSFQFFFFFGGCWYSRGFQAGGGCEGWTIWKGFHWRVLHLQPLQWPFETVPKGILCPNPQWLNQGVYLRGNFQQGNTGSLLCSLHRHFVVKCGSNMLLADVYLSTIYQSVIVSDRQLFLWMYCLAKSVWLFTYLHYSHVCHTHSHHTECCTNLIARYHQICSLFLHSATNLIFL